MISVSLCDAQANMLWTRSGPRFKRTKRLLRAPVATRGPQEHIKLQFNVFKMYIYSLFNFIGNDKRRRGAPKSILLPAPVKAWAGPAVNT